MLGHLGPPQLLILLLLGLLLFGPERLPEMVSDLGRFLRKVRVWAKRVGGEFMADLGPELGELDLKSLHPREFVRKHLLEDEVINIARQPAAFVPGGPVPWDPDTT